MKNHQIGAAGHKCGHGHQAAPTRSRFSHSEHGKQIGCLSDDLVNLNLRKSAQSADLSCSLLIRRFTQIFKNQDEHPRSHPDLPATRAKRRHAKKITLTKARFLCIIAVEISEKTVKNNGTAKSCKSRICGAVPDSRARLLFLFPCEAWLGIRPDDGPARSYFNQPLR